MPTPMHQKPATAAWIVRERKRLGLKPRDLVERLAAQGLTIGESTVKVWESNADRRPAPENLAGLERIFGSSAPDQGGDDGSVTAALVASLVAQTEALNRLAAALERQADLSSQVEEQGRRIQALEEAVASRFDEALAEAREQTAPHETAG